MEENWFWFTIIGISFCVLAIIFFVIGWQIYDPLRNLMNIVTNILTIIVFMYFLPIYYIDPLMFILLIDILDIFVEILVDIAKQLLIISTMYYILPLIGLISQILGAIFLAISAIYFRRSRFENRNKVDISTKKI